MVAPFDSNYDPNGNGRRRHRDDFEPGLRTVVRASRVGDDGVILEACRLLSQLLDRLGSITPNDKAILRAFIKHGTGSAAARALAPNRPWYQSYVSRRTRILVELTREIVRETAFGGLIRAARSRNGKDLR